MILPINPLLLEDNYVLSMNDKKKLMLMVNLFYTLGKIYLIYPLYLSNIVFLHF